MAAVLVALKRRGFCLTGLNAGSTQRRCSAFSRGTPGMSAGFHAKMLTFSLRKRTSVLSYFGSRFAPILVIFEESPTTSWISLASDGLVVFLLLSSSGISRSAGAAFLLPGPPQLEEPPSPRA